MDLLKDFERNEQIYGGPGGVRFRAYPGLFLVELSLDSR